MVTAMWSVSNRDRHIKLEVGRDCHARDRRRREGDHAGGHVDRPDRELLHPVLVDTHRAGDRLGDRERLDDAA
jgi:hypothetical protein